MPAPSLDCDGFADRLDAALDERRDPASDSALAEHATRCPGCAQSLRISGRLMVGLRTGGTHASAGWKPSPDWQAPIVGRERKSKRRFDRRWLGVAGGAAAAMIVATVVLSNRMTFNQANRPSTSQLEQQALAGPSSPPRLRQVRWDGYSAALQDWQARFDPEGTGRETLESSVEPIAAGIRPIGGSFGAVLGGLRRSVPIGRQRRSGTTSDSGAWIAVGMSGVA